MNNKISEKILILGYTEESKENLRKLKNLMSQESLVVGIVDNNVSKGEEIESVPFLGKVIDLEKIANENDIDGIVQIGHFEQSFNMIIFCRAKRLSYRVLNPGDDFHAKNFKKEIYGDLVLMKMTPTPLSGFNLLIKNFFDIIFSWFFTILFLPIFIIVYIALKVESFSSPVIVVEDRFNGYSGKNFRMYRFRTLPSGEKEFSEDYGYKEATEKLREIRRDKRATRVGRVLRKFYLSDLPQLFNVIKGEMSLVGPRPPYTKEVDDYTDSLRKRVIVKPGMTGLWQADREKLINFEKMFERDSFYVENWSFLLDIKIVFKTLGKIFLRGCK